ncbi:NUDIX hydrolase [Paenibacillus monticola]|uniref:NUDIX domain-containing protein n=1 Tax=Paenibacillus monticola TaxID=2666075 RepID=A0A7X2L1X4_9BACL|nr:NUDIX hydrolase [Paenibacillus monticola]MRN53605.1 NUDIX domain-containing protein [Paenibacillus monticola]
MTGMKSFRHFGVYGVCERAGKMLVIHKGKGPYTGRYDLPGGRLEDNESLLKGLEREFMEETGLSVKANSNLGTFDFFVRYPEESFTHMHHIAVLYAVEIIGNEEPQKLAMFEGQDSLGTEWVDLHLISLDSSSPVAVLAAEWLMSGILPFAVEY